LHIIDLNLLLQIQRFFSGIGQINIDQKNQKAAFIVRKLSDLNNVIISHFLNFPLLTQKAADFILFKKIIERINKKLHLTTEGLQEIINLKDSMNKGLPLVLKINLKLLNRFIIRL